MKEELCAYWKAGRSQRKPLSCAKILILWRSCQRRGCRGWISSDSICIPQPLIRKIFQNTSISRYRPVFCGRSRRRENVEAIRMNRMPPMIRVNEDDGANCLDAEKRRGEHDVSTAFFRQTTVGRQNWSGVNQFLSLVRSRLHCDSQYRNPALPVLCLTHLSISPLPC